MKANGAPVQSTASWLWNGVNFGQLRPLPVEIQDRKFSLIDLEGEIPNKAEGESHRERLSERTPNMGDAIVCSASNMKMQKSAEMTDSLPMAA